VDVAVLEFDALWKTFTPHPTYDETERDTFYQQLADVGALLTAQGVPVIFVATANRRTHRDHARQQIPHFLEIYVDCPLAMCIARDPKGIYDRHKRAPKARCLDSRPPDRRLRNRDCGSSVPARGRTPG
jgi:adenylylsulfate kinase